MVFVRAAILATGLLFAAVPAAAQGTPRALDVTFGYAGFVDEETDHFGVVGGAFRHYLTPRLSVGPEFVVMFNGDPFLNRAVMLTGNVTFDFLRVTGPSALRLTPFVIGGLGGFWARQSFPSDAFWAMDPAFTAGVGLRGRVSDRISVAAEYRVGWELHQRLTGTVTFGLR